MNNNDVKVGLLCNFRLFIHDSARIQKILLCTHTFNASHSAVNFFRKNTPSKFYLRVKRNFKTPRKKKRKGKVDILFSLKPVGVQQGSYKYSQSSASFFPSLLYSATNCSLTRVRNRWLSNRSKCLRTPPCLAPFR